MLAGGEELGQSRARLGAEFGAAEADRVEAERQRAVADQGFGINRVMRPAPGPHRRLPTSFRIADFRHGKRAVAGHGGTDPAIAITCIDFGGDGILLQQEPSL